MPQQASRLSCRTLGASVSINTTTSVPKEIATRALVAVETHPLRAEAVQWSYCVHDVFAMSKTFIDRGRFSEEEKDKLLSALTNEESILLVSYYTSSEKPDPLSGAGNHYVFLLHPTTLEVLQSSVGTWRS